jgi:DNA sulfur modification protein DndB
MSRTIKTSPLTIPSLRGTFGNWVYYCCLVPIRELAERAEYASELPATKSEEFDQMTEHVLDSRRAVEISRYLTNEDRFFNSLVLVVYGGKPDWFEIGITGTNTPNVSLSELSEEVKDSFGFLRLSGRERLFAIDGQHRLAGIKHAIVTNNELMNEFVPVVLVGHKNTPSGIRRTRRLFASLHRP